MIKPLPILFALFFIFPRIDSRVIEENPSQSADYVASGGSDIEEREADLSFLTALLLHR